MHKEICIYKKFWISQGIVIIRNSVKRFKERITYPFFIINNYFLLFFWSIYPCAHTLSILYSKRNESLTLRAISLSLVLFLELSSNYNECFVIIKTYAGDHRRGSSSDRRGCTQSFLHIWMHRDDLAGSMLSIVSHDFITYGLDKWFEILNTLIQKKW